jgi:cytochrome P450
MEMGTYLPIEQFPILKYIPDSWVSSKARATKCYETVLSTWIEGVNKVEERRNNGDERNSLTDRLLSSDLKSDVSMTRNQLSMFLGAIMQGAADTTASMMLTHILFLAKHPLAQEKAHAELNRVCGVERMPRWADFKDLPYINCILKEGLRIRPV